MYHWKSSSLPLAWLRSACTGCERRSTLGVCLSASNFLTLIAPLERSRPLIRSISASRGPSLARFDLLSAFLASDCASSRLIERHGQQLCALEQRTRRASNDSALRFARLYTLRRTANLVAQLSRTPTARIRTFALVQHYCVKMGRSYRAVISRTPLTLRRIALSERPSSKRLCVSLANGDACRFDSRTERRTKRVHGNSDRKVRARSGLTRSYVCTLHSDLDEPCSPCGVCRRASLRNLSQRLFALTSYRGSARVLFARGAIIRLFHGNKTGYTRADTDLAGSVVIWET